MLNIEKIQGTLQLLKDKFESMKENVIKGEFPTSKDFNVLSSEIYKTYYPVHSLYNETDRHPILFTPEGVEAITSLYNDLKGLQDSIQALGRHLNKVEEVQLVKDMLLEELGLKSIDDLKEIAKQHV